MTPLIVSIQLVLLTVVLFGVIAALVSALSFRRVLARVASMAPRPRMRLVLAFAAAPAALSLLLTGACLLPWLVSALSLALDHCESDNGHSHLCFTHGPATSCYAAWVLIALVAGYGLVRLARGIRAAVRAHHLVKELRALSHERPEHGLSEVHSPIPICIAAGLVRPTVIISSGLVTQLSPAELEAVLAHERAHVRRRDALWLAVARVLVIGHLPWVAQRILADCELASELACDDEAARSLGDALVVASAIVAVGRLVAGRRSASLVGVASFEGHALDARVRALVGERCAYAKAPSLSLIVGAFAAVGVLTSYPLHHATETVLSLLLH